MITHYVMKMPNSYTLIAVCMYRLVMIGKELSKKFTPQVQTVTAGADVIVTQITTVVCGNVATVTSYRSCILYANFNNTFCFPKRNNASEYDVYESYLSVIVMLTKCLILINLIICNNFVRFLVLNYYSYTIVCYKTMLLLVGLFPHALIKPCSYSKSGLTSGENRYYNLYLIISHLERQNGTLITLINLIR